jgi:hypothetical protein
VVADTRPLYPRTGPLKVAAGAADHLGVAPSAPRVLCYAPYNRWALHGQWEMTILHALKLRGAEVEYVLCDGLFAECDQFWAAHAPRPADACVGCQADVTKLCAELGMDYRWLGRYLTTDEHRAARAWAAAVPIAELLDASYEAWPIASWTRMSLQSHFRRNEPDLADPVVVRTVRGYLEAGLIAAFALDRLLAESAPDVLLLFNGRQSSLRVALELATARGIRVITHERGHRPETLMLVEDASCLSLERIRRYWREWGDVPLTAGEAQPVARLMREREHGRGLAWKALAAPPQPLAEVREQLELGDASRPLWVLFTSSDDELAGDLDWGSAFPTQRGWIDRTIAFAAAHPEIDLVVRIHPNTGSRRSHGVNAVQLAEMATLHDDVPANVRVIAPDEELSAYSLMDLATVGLVWVSTAGLELACKGKRVVVAASNPVSDTEFVTAVSDPDRYELQLGELAGVPAGAVSAETRRLALRFAYGFFFRMSVDFPLVRMPNPHQGVVGWTTPDELRPGREAGLDRCVRILLDGEATCPAPSDAERAARTTDAEDALLATFGRVTALAFAEEIIADATLLRAWARAFDGRADATLVIHTLAEHAEALVAAVTALGLEGEDGPDLLAIEADAALAGSVDAIFSRLDLGDDAFSAPRYDDTTVGRLAAR